jgi:hypothetical protein
VRALVELVHCVADTTVNATDANAARNRRFPYLCACPALYKGQPAGELVQGAEARRGPSKPSVIAQLGARLARGPASSTCCLARRPPRRGRQRRHALGASPRRRPPLSACGRCGHQFTSTPRVGSRRRPGCGLGERAGTTTVGTCGHACPTASPSPAAISLRPPRPASASACTWASSGSVAE